MRRQLNAREKQKVIASLGAIHRTLDALLTVGDYESAGSIARTLGSLWLTHGYIHDGMQYLSAVLDSQGSDELSESLLVALYENYGDLAQADGHYEQAEVYYKKLLSKHIDDPRTLVQLLLKLGISAYQRDQYEASLEYWNEGLVLAQQLDFAEGIAIIQVHLGLLAHRRGNFIESLDRLANAYTLSEKQGYREGLVRSLNAMGEAERAQHHYGQAIDHYRACVAVLQDENPRLHMTVKGNIAFSLLAVGEVTQAEALFAEGYGYWEMRHSLLSSALCLTGLAGVLASTQAYSKAARLIGLASQRLAQSDGHFDMVDRDEYERTVSSIQAHLSEDELRGIHAHVARPARGVPAIGFLSQSEMNDRYTEVSALSYRELEILGLVAQGLTDKQIAVQCGISPHTVDSHIRAVYRKLRVNSRTAALHVAHQQGLL